MAASVYYGHISGFSCILPWGSYHSFYQILNIKNIYVKYSHCGPIHLKCWSSLSTLAINHIPLCIKEQELIIVIYFQLKCLSGQ